MSQITEIKSIHLSEIIKIHKKAFKGYLNIKLGYIYLNSFFNWFIHNDTISLVCLEKNSPVGYVLGAVDGYQKKMNIDLFFSSLISFLINPKIFFMVSFWKSVYGRILIVFGIKKKKPSDLLLSGKKVMSLVAIGVNPSTTGSVFSTKLVNEFIKISKQKNIELIRLSVYSKNKKAISFYKKFDFKFLDSNSSEIKIMIKKI